MDIERIDWWEKERPPLVWLDKKDWDRYQEFMHGRKLKLSKYIMKNITDSDDASELSNYEKVISNMLDTGVLKPISNPCWFCGKQTQVISFREIRKNEFSWMAHCEKH